LTLPVDLCGLSRRILVEDSPSKVKVKVEVNDGVNLNVAVKLNVLGSTSTSWTRSTGLRRPDSLVL